MPAEGPKEQLWDASRRGDVKAVEALLKKGVDVNARTRFGATALWYAAYKGRVGVVKLLLEHKADPNLSDTVWGMSPLQLAVAFGKQELIGPMLDAKGEGEGALLTHAGG